MDFKGMLSSMQKKLQDMNKKKESARYKGSTGGGALTITINGDFYIIPEETHVDESLNDESADVILDMFVVAYNQARKIAQEDQDSSEGELLKGMPMPFNMKKPPF